MDTIVLLKNDLAKLMIPNKVKSLSKFFQAYPGGYGEGDRFIGVTVPNQRMIAKKFFKEISLEQIAQLLNQPIHEYRLTAIFMLVLKYQRTKNEKAKQEIVNTYLNNIERVNNWDLVDSSAHLILGHYVSNKDKGLLYEFTQSPNLWIQRIAVIATMHFIRNHQFEDTLRIAEILLNHKHDLIHKAVGWMLREVGNRNFQVENEFLIKNYRKMPRTMLRYAIEKFPEEIRQSYLKGMI